MASGAFALAPFRKAAFAQPAKAQEVDFRAVLTYSYAVPALPYAYDANEPAIDTLTMQLRYDKHHAAYVNNLNGAPRSVASA